MKMFLDSSVVIAEVTELAKRKFPEILKCFEQIKAVAKLKIAKKTTVAQIKEAATWISDFNDAPILASAKALVVDVLVTLDIRHFIKDPFVGKKSGLSIMTPADFLKGFFKVYL